MYIYIYTYNLRQIKRVTSLFGDFHCVVIFHGNIHLWRKASAPDLCTFELSAGNHHEMLQGRWLVEGCFHFKAIIIVTTHHH